MRQYFDSGESYRENMRVIMNKIYQKNLMSTFVERLGVTSSVIMQFYVHHKDGWTEEIQREFLRQYKKFYRPVINIDERYNAVHFHNIALSVAELPEVKREVNASKQKQIARLELGAELYKLGEFRDLEELRRTIDLNVEAMDKLGFIENENDSRQMITQQVQALKTVMGNISKSLLPSNEEEKTWGSKISNIFGYQRKQREPNYDKVHELIAELDEKYFSIKEGYATIQQYVSAIDTENNKLSQVHADCQAEYQALILQYQEKEKNLRAHYDFLDSRRHSYSKIDAQTERLKTQIKNLSTTNRNMQEELNTANNIINNAYTLEIQNFHVHYQSLEEKYQAAQQSYQEEMQRCRAEMNRCTVMQQEKEGLEQKLVHIQNNITDSFLSQHVKLQEEHKLVQKQCTTLQEDCNKLHQEHQQLLQNQQRQDMVDI